MPRPNPSPALSHPSNPAPTKTAPLAHTLPARPGADDRGALNAAARALGGARERAGDADAGLGA